MAYTKYNEEEKKILIYEERHQEYATYPLGELLFSFLELDFDEYNSIYTLCGYDTNFNQSTVDFLGAKYPKTIKECIKYPPDSMRDYALNFLLDNKDSFEELYDHPYLYFSDTILEGILGTFETEYFDANFQGLQNTLKELVEFCFLDLDSSKLNALSPVERYYLFTATKHQRFKYILNLHTTALFSPMAFYEDLQNEYCLKTTKCEDILFDDIPENILEQIKGNAKTILVNQCKTVQDFCFFEFYILLSHDFPIKRCINCGKLFISFGKHNTDCCDRIPKGEKYTCKKIMAQKRRKRKVNSNPIVKEYERAYKRNYARVTNHKMSAEDFRLWTEQATQKRDLLSAEYESAPSDQLIADFKQYLGNK